MIVILSPAKSLNFKVDGPTESHSIPIFINEAHKLIRVLQKHSPTKLTELMKISSGLGELNYLRFQKWELDHNQSNSKQAIFAFNGEVYNGFKAHTLDSESLVFAQHHIRILSGLYGILNPLDLVQPYRLEMSTKLKLNEFKNLYTFWDDKINTTINQELKVQKNECLINLASVEYSKAVKLKNINTQIITPVFKELSGDSYKVIPVYAKKARGLMSRFIVDNKIVDPQEIKHFDVEGYHYSDTHSTEQEWVFTR